MPQLLQNYSSAISTGSANELPDLRLISSNGTAANGSLNGINYWAARMIAMTREDWVKHGCCRRKKEKCAAPATVETVVWAVPVLSLSKRPTMSGAARPTFGSGSSGSG